MTVALLPPSLRRAVSRQTGIVHSLDECLAGTTDPPLHRVSCEVARSVPVFGEPLDHLEAVGGTGLSREDAAAACVGEALERYSATYVPDERVVIATADELGQSAAPPETFALFSKRQHLAGRLPYVPFSHTTRVPWVEGWSLRDGRPVWVPAALCFLADPGRFGGQSIGYATSSGMACAPVLEDALVRALCEVLERDAFMIVWANRLSLPRLDLSGEGELEGLVARLFGVTGLPYSAVDLSCVHELPSVLGVVRAPHGYPGALGVGAGTAPDFERALWKGLSEAFACRSAGQTLELLRPDSGEEVISFEDHIRYYANHEHATRAEFLDAAETRVTSEAVPALEGASAAEHLQALIRRVERAGSETYAVDVTAPDVRELGLNVVKIVAPGLCALDVPHAARFLGGERLYTAAAALGLEKRGPRTGRLRERDVNPDPHPFP